MAKRKVSNELWTALEPSTPEFLPSRKGGRRRTVDISPDDVFLSLVPVPNENFSFGKGIPQLAEGGPKGYALADGSKTIVAM